MTYYRWPTGCPGNKTHFISPPSPSVEAVTEHTGGVCSQPGWWLLLWAAPGTHTHTAQGQAQHGSYRIPATDPNEVAECWSWLPLLHAEVTCLSLALPSQPGIFTRPWGSHRGTCPALKRFLLAQLGKSLLCSWLLKICPITCQKPAVGGCANRCTKRQNYALQTAKKKINLYHLYLSISVSDSSTALSTCPCNVQGGVKGH